MSRAVIREVEAGGVINEECEPITSVSLLLEGAAEITYRRDSELGMPSFKLKALDRAGWVNNAAPRASDIPHEAHSLKNLVVSDLFSHII
jgi:hypothetical protein